MDSDDLMKFEEDEYLLVADVCRRHKRVRNRNPQSTIVIKWTQWPDVTGLHSSGPMLVCYTYCDCCDKKFKYRDQTITSAYRGLERRKNTRC